MLPRLWAAGWPRREAAVCESARRSAGKRVLLLLSVLPLLAVFWGSGGCITPTSSPPSFKLTCKVRASETCVLMSWEDRISFLTVCSGAVRKGRDTPSPVPLEGCAEVVL